MSLSLLLAVILDALRIFVGYDGVVYGSDAEPTPATETAWGDGNGGPPPR